MAQLVKTFATETGHLSSIHRTHRRGKVTPRSCPLIPKHASRHECAHTQTFTPYTHTITVMSTLTTKDKKEKERKIAQ